MIPFSLIVAIDSKNGIGKNGQLPWQLSADLKHFKEITCQTKDPAKQNVVIMGRKTWESLPEKFRPLPRRINLVLTKNKDLELPSNVLKARDFVEAFRILEKSPLNNQVENIFVIGGQQIFEQAINRPQCQRLYVTHIQKSFACDTFFPLFSSQFTKHSSSAMAQENGLFFFFAEYTRLYN